MRNLHKIAADCLRQRHLIAAFAAVVGLCLVGAVRADEADGLPELNSKVLQYAKERLGKRVGNGECWTLARNALDAAGARVPGTEGVGTRNFGRQLEREEKALPGDVVQFENVVLESRDGTVVEAAVHTAIILTAEGGKVLMLHQNWNGVRRVAKLDLSRFELKKGKMTVFRPVPAKR